MQHEPGSPFVLQACTYKTDNLSVLDPEEGGKNYHLSRRPFPCYKKMCN